jgi:hypothetical protein
LKIRIAITAYLRRKARVEKNKKQETQAPEKNDVTGTKIADLTVKINL